MSLSRYLLADTLKRPIPDVILSGELAYQGSLFLENWIGRVGVRSHFYNRQTSMQFDPQTLSFPFNYAETLSYGSTMDLFLVLKIGDAHVSISMNNVFGFRYIETPIYPMPLQNVRLSVNWVFLD